MPDTVIAFAQIGKKGVKYSLFSTAFASSRLKSHAAQEITAAPYDRCRQVATCPKLGTGHQKKKSRIESILTNIKTLVKIRFRMRTIIKMPMCKNR
jgi:hypothetical protein